MNFLLNSLLVFFATLLAAALMALGQPAHADTLGSTAPAVPAVATAGQ